MRAIASVVGLLIVGAASWPVVPFSATNESGGGGGGKAGSAGKGGQGRGSGQGPRGGGRGGRRRGRGQRRGGGRRRAAGPAGRALAGRAGAGARRAGRGQRRGVGGASGQGGAGGAGGSAPVCSGVQQACGGQCVDVQTDAARRGKCGNACGEGASCCEGVCAVVEGCSFVVTKLSNNQGWQSGGDYITLTGKGFAKGMKAFIGDGRAPVRVIDGGTALMATTPPGPAGAQDVTVDLNGTKATLPKAFTYVSAGLNEKWEQKPMQLVRGRGPGAGGDAGREGADRGGHDGARLDRRRGGDGRDLQPLQRHGGDGQEHHGHGAVAELGRCCCSMVGCWWSGAPTRT